MAIWLSFNELLKWSNLPEFDLDRLTDEAIASALARPDLLKHASISRDGLGATVYPRGSRGPELKAYSSAFAVARLVQYLQLEKVDGVRQGQLARPMSVDWEQPWCAGYLGRGEQVIRALQYMGLTSGPFVLVGRRDALDRLCELARVGPPGDNMRHIFSPELLRRNAGDIKYRCSRHVDGAKDEEASELGFYPTLPGKVAPPRVVRNYE
jgi:hypothetical protein